MKKTTIAIMTVFCLGLSPLYAQENLSREQKLDKIVDFFDDFDLVGLIRFRPEYKDNFDFDKNGTTCKGSICTDNNDNNEFVGQKIQIGFNYLGESVKASVILQDARVWGGEAGSSTGLNTANSSTNQSTDIREAWIEFEMLEGLALQLGRQKLVYGDQRLVGHLDWTNIGRSFDGLRFKYNASILETHLFGMVLGEEDSDTVGNNVDASSTQDNYMSGFYNTLKFSDDFHSDLYYFGIYKKWKQSTTAQALASNSTPVQQITTTDRSRDRDNLHTIGFRLHNKTKNGGKDAAGPFDWTIEYAHQQGESGRRVAASWDTADVVVPLDSTVFSSTANPCRVYSTSKLTGNQGCKLYLEKEVYDAFAGAITTGFSFAEKYRIGVEYAVGSGDPDRTDASIATFHNLMPTNHLFYGQADMVSLQNMTGKSVNFTMDMDQYGKIKLAYWQVDKHKNQDAWYGVGGGGASGATRTTTESASNSKYQSAYNSDGSLNSLGVGFLRKHLFKEYDITYVVKVGDLDWSLGYSLIVAGDTVGASKADYGVFYQTYYNDVKDGKIDTTVALMQFIKPSFDKEAHYFYVQMQYKF